MHHHPRSKYSALLHNQERLWSFMMRICQDTSFHLKVAHDQVMILKHRISQACCNHVFNGKSCTGTCLMQQTGFDHMVSTNCTSNRNRLLKLCTMMPTCSAIPDTTKLCHPQTSEGLMQPNKARLYRWSVLGQSAPASAGWWRWLGSAPSFISKGQEGFLFRNCQRLHRLAGMTPHSVSAVPDEQTVALVIRRPYTQAGTLLGTVLLLVSFGGPIKHWRWFNEPDMLRFPKEKCKSWCLSVHTARDCNLAWSSRLP